MCSNAKISDNHFQLFQYMYIYIDISAQSDCIEMY